MDEKTSLSHIFCRNKFTPFLLTDEEEEEVSILHPWKGGWKRIKTSILSDSRKSILSFFLRRIFSFFMGRENFRK